MKASESLQTIFFNYATTLYIVCKNLLPKENAKVKAI